LTITGCDDKIPPAYTSTTLSVSVPPPSSRGPGRDPFKVKTGVRIPVGAQDADTLKGVCMFKADAAVARPAAAQGGDANGSLRRGKYPRLSARAVWTWMGFGRRCSPNYGPWSGMGIDHATTHADFLADSLHSWLKEDTTWDMAMKQHRRQARAWSEKNLSTYLHFCCWPAADDARCSATARAEPDTLPSGSLCGDRVMRFEPEDYYSL
jgi:hypothetical protein